MGQNAFVASARKLTLKQQTTNWFYINYTTLEGITNAAIY
ncbi:hypothetical protein SALWKB12_0628 [Snodgrassella communis]|uniref:Uncharacterized protein n=1 Tax=Snodgrassella communis TaxID=2946699 RepID=A0A836Z665_9NEIS|nr:hypothetical protein SALWKB12_0628 [Snodgrassella communis]KDN15130.1 hypothetical protein SALWKB29_0756 [Snodgrassella communis]